MTDATFRDLYSRYRDPLFRFGYRLTGSPETAEDMVHDVFVGLYRGSFDAARASASTYLFAGVRNQARKRLRDYAVDDEPAEDLSDARSGPLDTLLAAETAEQVRCAVAALPFAQREALILFEYEELSLDEIARVVEAELGTVKARLYRAREGLRRNLGRRVREVAK
ncbi:MAG: transcriptional regulator, Fis family [Bryobacterales bacterium]|jgi:RNA polymerase sigma factor (sigma-70 family)|nr:transcriptional regulator, Fis family [Bryobacterales bacterium]